MIKHHLLQDKMTMIMDAVKSHSTNGENNPQEEAMQCVYTTLNVPVNDHAHRVQNDDEQEHQGTEDADQRENIIIECENGDDFIHQFGENGQKKKIQLASGKTNGSGHDPNRKNVEGKKVGKSDNAPGCSKSFEYYYDNVPWKSKHGLGSGSKKTRKADKLEPKKKEHFARFMVPDENVMFLGHVGSLIPFDFMH
jgi:hypothetical protein